MMHVSAPTLLVAISLVLGMLGLVWVGMALGLRLLPRACLSMAAINGLMATSLLISALHPSPATWLWTWLSDLTSQVSLWLLCLVPAWIGGRSAPWRLVLGLALLGQSLLQYVFWQPRFEWHTSVIFGQLAVAATLSGIEAYRLGRQRLRRGISALISSPLMLIGLLLALRALSPLVLPYEERDLRGAGEFNLIFLWSSLVLGLVTDTVMASLVLMKLVLDIRQLTMFDPLTGVMNRRAFELALTQAHARFQRGQPYALVMLDMDFFKQLNDKLGHAAGDAALKAMVTVMRPCVREVDALARLGGEEFAVLLVQTDQSGAALVAERMRAMLQALQFEWKGQPWTLSASFGIAEAQPGDGSAEPVLARADRALYMAKRLGRNLVQ